MNNHRPVSNLCSIAKILEKLVLSQVSSYLNSHNLNNTCQSAYPPGHSTETALLKVANDLFISLNKGNISVLALLDYSSAFNTIDHPILVHRLYIDFGFTDTVLQWFSSYLTNHTHYISLSNHCSAFAPVHSGVPRGSILGPILFTMYIKPLSAIIDNYVNNWWCLECRPWIQTLTVQSQHQYVFSLSKILYPHCFSRLSCEMSTRWGQPREGCSVL